MRKLALILLLLLCFVQTACGAPAKQPSGQPSAKAGQAQNASANASKPVAQSQANKNYSDSLNDWSIYWYLCGSDLESNYGYATTDLMELLDATIPEGVTVVIQTGGARLWSHPQIKSNKIQRWAYSGDTLYLVDEQPLANMGDPNTLESFLIYASANYPAQKTGVIFWNHGGGSVTGAAFDENYYGDSLTLSEMDEAFNNVYGKNKGNPPLELVGFDTCLMATIDTADTFSNYAKYLVASEENEPGNGWYYTGWADALANNPSMGGDTLGRVICDTYMEGCKYYGTQNKATLSVTDLSKIEPLMDAYEYFGAEALQYAVTDPSFFTHYARVAKNSENYGGNTKDTGFSDMVDLGHVARQQYGIMDTAPALLNALEDAVIYKVAGKYRNEATGLSFFYCYDNSADSLYGYLQEGAGETMKAFYNYAYTGEVDENVFSRLPGLSPAQELKPVPTLLSMGWDGKKLELSDDGASLLVLGPEANDILSRITFNLFYVEPQSDTLVLLGSDNELYTDWDNGVFKDNFYAMWGSIDGELVYMELTEETEEYLLYTCPILLNGEEYNLLVAYDNEVGDFVILGANQGIDENGMADKEMRLLKPGDVVTPILYMGSLENFEDAQPIPMNPITITESTTFGGTELPEGTYSMVYVMEDALGNTALSDPAFFEYADGQITTMVLE